jgi:hypothetical protein
MLLSLHALYVIGHTDTHLLVLSVLCGPSALPGMCLISMMFREFDSFPLPGVIVNK